MKYVEDLQQVDFKEFGTHIQFNDVLTRSTHYAKVIDSDKKDMHEQINLEQAVLDSHNGFIGSNHIDFNSSGVISRSFLNENNYLFLTIPNESNRPELSAITYLDQGKLNQVFFKTEDAGIIIDHAKKKGFSNIEFYMIELKENGFTLKTPEDQINIFQDRVELGISPLYQFKSENTIIEYTSIPTSHKKALASMTALYDNLHVEVKEKVNQVMKSVKSKIAQYKPKIKQLEN
tara:strand:- start:1679 stop:2377 length:699 start_codon:yes stop_codon:yes gene_type:complete